MSLFNSLYSEYYDIMYLHKNYRSEVAFFNTLIKKFHKIKPKMVLSLGAGTLNHELILDKLGYDMTCVEVSKDMINRAKKKISKKTNIKLVHADMRKVNMEQRFDVALSMFNVVSYCKNQEDLEKFFNSANLSLKKGGLLVFDCWNLDAVLKNPPLSPWVKYKKGKKLLYRLTSSSLNEKKQIVRMVDMIEVEGGKITRQEKEKHVLSAWRLKQLRSLLESKGFNLLHSCVFMNMNKAVNDEDWNMTIIAAKNENI